MLTMNASVSKRDKPPRESRRKGSRAERTSFAYEGTNTRTVGPTKLPRAEIELTSKQMSKGHLLTFLNSPLSSKNRVDRQRKVLDQAEPRKRPETLTLSRAIIGISVGVFIPALLQF
ncbi:hypothetical protein PI125_g7587 [Phytophthora idaei]|nr:hypothetical protein PI125_g7587 [Phytophthora idaei]